MINYFQKRRIRKTLRRLFPFCADDSVSAVAARLTYRKKTPFEAFYAGCEDEQWLLFDRQVRIPYRASLIGKGDEGLSEDEKVLYYGILSRSFDGYERENAVRELLKRQDRDLARLYLMKSAEDYVASILKTLYDGIRKDDKRYRLLASQNFDQIARGHTRMISYWNEYYRTDCYRYRDWIGKRLYSEAFGYRKTGQKQIVIDSDRKG